MKATLPLLLVLGILGPMARAAEPVPPDTARLRELLYDQQHPRNQSQAALLLLQSPAPEADEIVRHGLTQADSPEVFLALAGAMRLSRDTRFTDEVVAALRAGQPVLCQAAAQTLAELADTAIVRRLQAVVEDTKGEPAARKAALWALGQSGSKSAVMVLLDQLSSEEEFVRQTAADALANLTGQAYGLEAERWRTWWEQHKDFSNERWLEERLAFQTSRARRLEGDLDRAKAQVVSLHQQLYARLPVADRLRHVQALAEHEDPAVRTQAIPWAVELLPSADAVGQGALANLLLRLSRDGTLDVQRSATLALGRLPDARAYERLRILLAKGRAPVRAAAARALPQQVRGTAPEALHRQREIVAALQKSLDDPALEVILEAAEGLGSLGIPEAGPVLMVLLRHPSGPVRQAAAQALERVADMATLDGLLEALDDPIVAVRFSLVGALGHAAGEGQALQDAQRTQLQARLEALLLRDADPGVRSRAATVLGQCGSPSSLPTLWQRVLASEDSRVQEKAWSALLDIIVRAASVDLLKEWDRTLAEAQQGARRLALLTEVYGKWQKKAETKNLASLVIEVLLPVQLEQNKWAAALPLLHELLAKPGNDAEVEQRLRWLLAVGNQALKEGNHQEALRVVREAQPLTARRAELAGEFEKLEKEAHREP